MKAKLDDIPNYTVASKIDTSETLTRRTLH